MVNRLHPDLVVRCLSDIKVDVLHARGINSLLLDLDNTLVPYNSLEITEETVAWIELVQAAGLALCLVSNAHPTRLEKTAGPLGLPFVGLAKKPRRQGFRRGLEVLQAKADETAIIGDQIFTDVLGGKRSGLFTIYIAHELYREQWWMGGVRRLEKAILKSGPVAQ